MTTTGLEPSKHQAELLSRAVAGSSPAGGTSMFAGLWRRPGFEAPCHGMVSGTFARDQVFNVAGSGPLSTVTAPPVQLLHLSRGVPLASASGQDHVTSRRASAAERVAGRYRAPGEQSTQPLRRRCSALAGPKPAGTTDSPNSAPAAQLAHALRGAPMWSEFRHPGPSTLVVRVLRLVVHGVPPAEVAGVASVLPWR